VHDGPATEPTYSIGLEREIRQFDSPAPNQMHKQSRRGVSLNKRMDAGSAQAFSMHSLRRSF